MAKGRRPARTRRMGRVSYGEAELSYGGYLRVSELLDLQTLLSHPPAHDELLFIIVHQAYELWFKEMLFELESARDLMVEGNVRRACHYLDRVHAIERVLVEQINVLETMTPQDFLEFRSNLAPASGFQSAQFREIEFLSGLKEERYVGDVGDSPEEVARLRRRLEEPTLWDAFCQLLEEHGLPMPADDPEIRLASLLTVARERDKYPELFDLSEALLTHDELFSLWRHRHVLMVEREIGAKPGTGGSSGVPYLKSTLGKKFFPELWALRSHL